ncbi:dopamine beta-hydroxylase-like [Babylonia areolata]|uniref:dopamine beta-hydroxylase-like n=1 Tax=Babylonia areolata TaxID=304850 RepID=UPI003FCEF831
MKSKLKISVPASSLVPLLLVVVVGLVARVDCYPTYKERLPNGDQVPHPCKPNYLWHGVGHTNPLGGGPKNSFGADFLRFGATWNEALCRADSDGDGLTNGQELGDPDCTWTQGALPNRTTSITHPGVCDPWENKGCSAYNAWVDCSLGDFDCPALHNDTELRNVTLRFPSTPVPSAETTYMCMTFDLPDDDVYDIVADQPFIDNAQVMHHMLLMSCEGARDPPVVSSPVPCGMAGRGCRSIIAGWTVGSPGMCHSDQAGFRFGKGRYTRVKLQFHWNNPELRSDHTDSSGLTLFYTRRLRPNEATTMVVGQRVFQIPPRQPSVQVTGTFPSSCSRRLLAKPVYVVNALNHMHYLGRSEKIELFRQGRLMSSITNEEVYSYDNPIRVNHNPPIQILPGDDVKVTCMYNSRNKNSTVLYGDGTSDEMCYGFLTVYPQDAFPYTTSCISFGEESLCDRFLDDEDSDSDDSEENDDDTTEPRPGAGSDRPPTSGDDTIEGCNWRVFTNTSSPEFRHLAERLSVSCDAFGSCRRECGQLLARFARHPCLHGDAWEHVKGALSRSMEGLMVTAHISSCPLVFCPLCQRCRQ